MPQSLGKNGKAWKQTDGCHLGKFDGPHREVAYGFKPVGSRFGKAQSERTNERYWILDYPGAN